MLGKSLILSLYYNIKNNIIYIITPPLLLKDEIINSNKKPSVVKDEIIGSNKEPLLNTVK